MTDIKNYIQENSPRFMEELFSLLRIPSVSAVAAHKEDMYVCANRYVELLLASGADFAQVYETAGHPVVFGKKILDEKLPTILVYGHYDVQPEDPIELWKTNPYEPEIRDGAIYARGANDDKGQTFMHLKAFEYLLKNNLLKCNVKFILEGEEEIGSPSLAQWVEEHKELLSCNEILVSDTTMLAEDVPSINCGMRGLAYLQVKVTGPDKDLHSGHYGGSIANPIQVLCTMLASLIDANGRITVKGFYDKVVELSKEDRALLAKAPHDEKEFMESIGIDAVCGEKGYTTKERIGIRPCLDICGIWGGSIGEGSKTVLPSYACAKVSMRLVPNQRSAEIMQLFKEHFLSIAPKGVKVEVTPCHGGEGFLTPLSSKAYKSAAKAVSEVYGIEAVPARGGGSIAILADMQNILGANPLLMGFGLERDTIHSPNESYLLSQFNKGIESIVKFYQYYCE